MTKTTQWVSIIRDLQREHGISGRAIARKAKVHHSLLRRILSGKNNPRIGDIERILKVFGYDLDAIAVRREGSCR